MAPSPVFRLGRSVPLLAVEAAVDQAAHGARARRVLGPVVPVRLAQALVAAHPSDPMLDDDALPREGPVGPLRPPPLLLPTRLAARRRAAPVQLVDAPIALSPPMLPSGGTRLHNPRRASSVMSAVGPGPLSDTSAILPVSGSTATWTFTVGAFFLLASSSRRPTAGRCTRCSHALTSTVSAGMSVSSAAACRRRLRPGSGRRIVSRPAASSSGSTRSITARAPVSDTPKK